MSKIKTKVLIMAKDNEQQTMEEYLLSQLDTPVVLKDGTMMTKPDGSPMTKQEAIATNILRRKPKGKVNPRRYCARIVENIMYNNLNFYEYGWKSRRRCLRWNGKRFARYV